jgi:hypothetical protein
VTTFTTPGGNPASANSRAVSTVAAGVCSEGLITNVFPQASAGAALNATCSPGEFHGVIAATTPIGSTNV